MSIGGWYKSRTFCFTAVNSYDYLARPIGVPEGAAVDGGTVDARTDLGFLRSESPEVAT